jgi:hypothetical protein
MPDCGTADPAFQLGNDQLRLVPFTGRQGGLKLRALVVLAALHLNEFLHQRPAAAVQIVKDSLALRFQAKARFALLIRRDPEIRDEFPPMRRHDDLSPS